MSYFWTPEHRAARAARCRQHRPREKSIGPRSEEGQARGSKNRHKGGIWKRLRELTRILREQRDAWR